MSHFQVLGASHYSYCATREDKLTYLFHEVCQVRIRTSSGAPYMAAPAY